MGNLCAQCCGPVQDLCRDLCGCSPCRCCKTAEVKVDVDVYHAKILAKKEIPNGKARIYPGVCKADMSYSSPVLEIHTWHQARDQTDVTHGSYTQKVALGGIQTARDNADRHVGPLTRTEHRRMEMVEQIRCIPIESIISIRYAGEMKKELTEQIHARLMTPPPPDEGSCCCKLFCCCCCCCGNTDNRVHVDPGRTINQIVNQKGEHVIRITIEHLRYSNINTPSYFRALATTDAAVYFKDHFHTDLIEFYLIDNDEFDQSGYDIQRVAGAKLCRLVTNLKAMADQYPDASILNTIMNAPEVEAIGESPRETMDRLVGSGVAVTTIAAKGPLAAIEN